MKACALHALGDLRCREVPTPVPGPGEALIRVGACGVCGSDIPRVFTKGTYRFPTIPGHEFAGTVEAVGPETDAAWVGQRVAVFPLIPCRACSACTIGAYAQCADYDYLGSRSDGAFAEYVCAPVWNLLPVPDAVSMEEAAMAEPAAVAAHALGQANLELGDSVLIFGAGPIGLLLALWAKTGGAKEILLADIDEAKLDFARELGFSQSCNPRETDAPAWAMEQTGRGADVVIEGTGSAAAFEQCVQAARPFGRVVLMGNPAGAMTLSQHAYWAVLRKELTLRGTWNSRYVELPRNEWRLALEAMASGQIPARQLITHRVKLDALKDALEMMRDRTAFFNKVMVAPANSEDERKEAE